MLYEDYIPFESLHELITEQKIKLPFPLEYTVEKIEKVKKNMLKSYDNIARMLALSRPIVELVLFELEYDEPEPAPNSRGKPGVPLVAHVLIHLSANTML